MITELSCGKAAFHSELSYSKSVFFAIFIYLEILLSLIDMKVFQKLFDPVIKRLERELPEGLFYHSPAHTRDVIRAAERLGEAENINTEEREILALAALFHDSGFLVGFQNHEEHSCRIAIEYLTHEPCSPEHIRRICEMIRATKIPQLPTDLLSKILCDSDLDYLGRDDYFEIAERLFHELVHYKRIQNRPEWVDRQIQFLEEHTYFTAFAQQSRSLKKQQHIASLKQMQKEFGSLFHPNWST